VKNVIRDVIISDIVQLLKEIAARAGISCTEDGVLSNLHVTVTQEILDTASAVVSEHSSDAWGIASLYFKDCREFFPLVKFDLGKILDGWVVELLSHGGRLNNQAFTDVAFHLADLIAQAKGEVVR
jgi:hypothetical protein